MGQMRFYATQDAIPRHAWEQAYLAGLEAIPWRSSNHWADGTLCLERDVSDSGSLHIPWRVPGLGQQVLSTCTLMERPEPYHLATELARGTLHRARTLVAELEARQAAVPERVERWMAESVAAFLQATTSPSAADADADAARAIARACDVIDAICHDVVLHQIHAARAAGGPLPSLLAARLELDEPDDASHRYLDGVFQAVSLPFRWACLQPTEERGIGDARLESQIASCRAQRFPVFAGPLLQLDPMSLPAWVTATPGDYERFETAARQYVQGVVSRFRDAVDVWICAGRLNLRGSMGFSEEQRLRLAVVMIEAVRESCGRSPW